MEDGGVGDGDGGGGSKKKEEKITTEDLTFCCSGIYCKQPWIATVSSKCVMCSKLMHNTCFALISDLTKKKICFSCKITAYQPYESFPINNLLNDNPLNIPSEEEWKRAIDKLLYIKDGM